MARNRKPRRSGICKIMDGKIMGERFGILSGCTILPSMILLFSCRIVSGLDHAEVFIEHRRQFFTVGMPMFGGWIILPTGNPVAIELVDGGVNEIALEP